MQACWVVTSISTAYRGSWALQEDTKWEKVNDSNLLADLWLTPHTHGKIQINDIMRPFGWIWWFQEKANCRSGGGGTSAKTLCSSVIMTQSYWDIGWQITKWLHVIHFGFWRNSSGLIHQAACITRSCRAPRCRESQTLYSLVSFRDQEGYTVWWC